MWMDVICSVTTEGQRDHGKTWWPCGAQWCHPGAGWPAGWQSTHCTTAPICSARFSSLPRGSRFLTEQGARTGLNNEQFYNLMEIGSKIQHQILPTSRISIFKKCKPIGYIWMKYLLYKVQEYCDHLMVSWSIWGGGVFCDFNNNLF